MTDELSSNLSRIRITFGMVVTGESDDLRMFLNELEDLLQNHRGVRLIHKHQSAGKIWLTEDKPESVADG